jgi:GGDEF domain-containing protein
MAHRVIEALREPVRVDDKELYTGASVGIAVSNAGYRTPEELLRDADIAMYRAKAAGGARFEFFDAATTPSVPAVPAQRQPSVDAV